LVAYLASVGLEKADKLAGVLGLLVAVVALVAPYLLPSPDKSPVDQPSVQSVTSTVVGGGLRQVRGGHDVTVRRSAPQGSLSTPPPLGAEPSGNRGGGQYVDGVWVGGDVTQVDGADGDVTID
jgi:hypothetical protein